MDDSELNAKSMDPRLRGDDERNFHAEHHTRVLIPSNAKSLAPRLRGNDGQKRDSAGQP
jgi:hypothetical protein